MYRSSRSEWFAVSTSFAGRDFRQPALLIATMIVA